MRFTGLKVLLAALALTGCSTVLVPVNDTITVPLVASTEQADAALAEVRRERASIDARYAAAEQVCYAKFFVTNCLDKAKEERRIKQAYLNAVENDAQYFKRKASVDERDRQLAQAEKEFAADEARRAAEPAPAPREPTKPMPPAKKGKLAGRQAQHAAKVAQQAEEDKVKAAEVGGNVAAFAKKQADAGERQRKVAEKVAQKAAQKAAKKAAADAAPTAPTN